MLNGLFLKELRSVKGLTQKEIVGNYLSRSSLARFEKGLSSISLEASYEVSSKLGLSLQEFKYEIVDTEHLVEYRNMITRYYYYSRVNRLSDDELEEINEIYNYFYKKRYDGVLEFSDYIRVRTHLLPLLDSNVIFLELPEEDLNFVIDYFENIKKFFLIDFKILADICRQLDYKLLKKYYLRMVPINLEYYAVYSIDERTGVHQFLNNFFDRALSEEDMDIVQDLLEEHERFLRYFPNTHYEELFLINKATYELVIDCNVLSLKRMNDLIEAFDILGKKNLSAAVQEIMENILSNKGHSIPQNFVHDN